MPLPYVMVGNPAIYLPTMYAKPPLMWSMHALSCTRSGFHTLRHNNIQNLTANMLTEVCHEVGTEPHLQPPNGEHLAKATAIRDNSARLDIAASGFGVEAQKRQCLTLGFLTPSPQPTGNPACLPLTLGTKKRRRGLTAKESRTWNLPPAHH